MSQGTPFASLILEKLGVSVATPILLRQAVPHCLVPANEMLNCVPGDRFDYVKKVAVAI